MENASSGLTNNPTSQMPASMPAKKNSNAPLIIVIVLLVLCCVCSLVGTGVYFLNQRNLEVVQDPIRVNNNNGSNTDQPTNSNGNNGNTDNNQGNTDAPTNNAPQGSFLEAGSSFDVSVDRVTTKGDDYEIELSLKNKSSTAQAFSTLFSLSLVSESNTYGYSQNFLSPRYQREGAVLDGEVKAGETKRGVVVFNVNDNPSDLKLRVSKGFFSDEYAEFNIK